MKDWKIIVFFSGIALFLSLTAGLFGGVSFPVVLFRGFTGAVVFGGLGFAVSHTVRKFLPELIESGNLAVDTETVEANEAAGSNVDIVIDDPQDEDLLEEEIPIVNADVSGEVDDLSSVYEEDEEDEEEAMDSGKIPDIESLGGAFETNEGEHVDNLSGGGKMSIDIMGEEQDPVMVAKAIRTIIKKDQEG